MPKTSQYSEIDIANMALGRLGQEPIAAFGQVSGASTIMKQSYAHERDMLLRKIPWNFARKWVSLVQLIQVPLSMSITGDADGVGSIGFTAAYALPDDYLRLYRFSPRSTHWRVVGDTILSDAASPTIAPGMLLGLQPPNADGAANAPGSVSNIGGSGTVIGIEYIRQITDPNAWDTLFRDAFIARLTWIFAIGNTGSDQTQMEAKQEFQSALTDAAAVNGMEQWPDTWNDTRVQDVRFGYSGIGLDY